jgi:hypothetical protein
LLSKFAHVISLIFSIEVVLAQLPRHTVAKKVENYEHLDLLWGKDVDKVVFPHVLGFLKTYAPIELSKSQDAQSSRQVESANPPAYSTDHTGGVRKRGVDGSQREPGALYTQAAGDDFSHHAQTVGGISYAGIASESTEAEESNESDSDETMGECPSFVKSGISFADTAKTNTQDNKSTASTNDKSLLVSENHAPGIDKPVTAEISYVAIPQK